MFLILLDYTAPLDRIDAALPAHAEWLDANYAAGHFVASGRKEPRTGGVILAVGTSNDEITALAGTDPFAVAGLATHTVVEFLPSRTAPGYEHLG
jgi:uncharacterized protein YciI